MCIPIREYYLVIPVIFLLEIDGVFYIAPDETQIEDIFVALSSKLDIQVSRTFSILSIGRFHKGKPSGSDCAASLFGSSTFFSGSAFARSIGNSSFLANNLCCSRIF